MKTLSIAQIISSFIFVAVLFLAPSVGWTHHVSIGFWKLADCSMADEIEIFTENNKHAVVTTKGDSKKLHPITPKTATPPTQEFEEKGAEGKRLYRITKKNILKIYQNNELLCTGKPKIFTRKSPLLDQN